MLGGFPPFPWGQNGDGPQPPDLASLKLFVVDMNKVETWMDLVLGIDSAANPRFKQGGELRELMRVCMASLLM